MAANRKREITETILSLLDHVMDVDTAMRTWYQNIRRQGGMRLTESGRTALMAANLQNWSLEIEPRTITKSMLIEMDRKIPWPYYIDTRRKKLILFSSRDAMMMSIYGDLEKWIKSLG